MKECYICEKCGDDFDTKKECLAHEKTCDGRNAMLKRIAAIEKRLERLEDAMRSKADISQLPYKVNLCCNDGNTSKAFCWSEGNTVNLVQQVRDSMNRKKRGEKKTE